MLLLGGGLLMLGLIFAAMFVASRLKDWAGGGAGGGGEGAVRDMNFAFKRPGPPWEDDPDTLLATGVTVFASHRADPEAWVALSATRYDKTPSPSELRTKLHKHLGGVFANLPAPNDLTLEPVKWAGKDAQKYAFRLENKTTGAASVGEATVLADQGFGYWFYAWSPERDADAAAKELADLRDRFQILGAREGWSDKAAAGDQVTYRGEKNASYRLSNFERWNPIPGLDPTSEDPKADLLRKRTIKSQGRDAPAEARLVVFVLDGGSPAEVAGKYVRNRYTADPDLYGKRTVAELPGGPDPEADSPDGPEATATLVIRLRVSPADKNVSNSSEKLVVYSAIQAGNEVIAAEASCPWSERLVWERRMVQLVGSLRPAGP